MGREDIPIFDGSREKTVQISICSAGGSVKLVGISWAWLFWSDNNRREWHSNYGILDFIENH
jgi:hypothetical protein